jgi:flagellar FliL protein
MPPEEAVEAKNVEKKKAFLPKIIILVVLVALLGGGGYIGWVKFLKKPESTAEKKPQSEPDIKQEMGTFLVNLADPGGKRYLKVSLQAELSDREVAKEISDRSVEIRDTVLMLLSSKEYDEIGSVSGKMALKQDLMTRINRFLHTGQIKELYFTEFLVQ